MKTYTEHADRLVPKLLLTRKETAWSLGISERTVSTIVARGDLKPVRLGGKTLFRPADLEELVEREAQDLGANESDRSSEYGRRGHARIGVTPCYCWCRGPGST